MGIVGLEVAHGLDHWDHTCILENTHLLVFWVFFCHDLEEALVFSEELLKLLRHHRVLSSSHEP